MAPTEGIHARTAYGSGGFHWAALESAYVEASGAVCGRGRFIAVTGQWYAAGQLNTIKHPLD